MANDPGMYTGSASQWSRERAGADHPQRTDEQSALTFSIVIPAHNEEEALRPTIGRLYHTLAEARIPFEIVVVNDHSTDGTAAVLAQLAVEYPGVRAVTNEKPGGFGRAIQTGLEHFAGDAVCIVMADASDDPHDVVTYYRKLQQGYECVFGSRFVRGSRVVDYPQHKLFVNRLANWFINVMFQLHFNDTTNAFKAYRREVITGIMPFMAPHFNITVELPLKAITRGYHYTTVPINWYNRATGVSKLKIQEMGSRYLFIVLYVWLEQLLSRGDYRRPMPSEGERQAESDQELTQKREQWAQFETIRHRATLGSDIRQANVPAIGIPVGSRNARADVADMDTARMMTVATSSRAPRQPDIDNDKDTGKSIPDGRRIPGLFVWLVSCAVVLLGLAIYSPSLNILPLADDWIALHLANLGSGYAFGLQIDQASSAITGYHFDPISQGIIYVVYQLFGTNPVPYHVITLVLFSVGVALVLQVGWKLTGSFTIGVLASLLFVLSGRQYEGVIWTLVAIYQTLGLALYLGGLLFYLHAQGRRGRQRLWLLIGFYACMVLAVFTYEQEVTLFAACMLYRLFVIEHGRGLGWKVLLARARVWALEFGFPIVFFAGYLAFKVLLGHQTGRSQTPGLHLGIVALMKTITIGLSQSFTPGIIPGKLWNLQLALFESILFGHPVWIRLIGFTVVLAPIAAIVLFARPVYRWLALWSLLVVVLTVLGIGGVASRYQMQFMVPAVIIWAGFLVWIARSLRAVIQFLTVRDKRRAQRLVPALAWALVIMFVAAYGLQGVQYTFAQETSWQQASSMEGDAIQRITNLAVAHPGAQTLYLVDLPDGLDPLGGPPARWFDHGAYLFLNGAPYMMRFSMPGRFQTIQYLRTPTYFSNGALGNIDPAQLNTLSNDATNLVVCFSSQTQQIEPWGPLCSFFTG